MIQVPNRKTSKKKNHKKLRWLQENNRWLEGRSRWQMNNLRKRLFSSSRIWRRRVQQARVINRRSFCMQELRVSKRLGQGLKETMWLGSSQVSIILDLVELGCKLLIMRQENQGAIQLTVLQGDQIPLEEYKEDNDLLLVGCFQIFIRINICKIKDTSLVHQYSWPKKNELQVVDKWMSMLLKQQLKNLNMQNSLSLKKTTKLEISTLNSSPTIKLSLMRAYQKFKVMESI